jgi:uncharacterized protein (DUF302 family)
MTAHSVTTGVVQIRTSHTVADTVDRLEHLARERGLTVFARIDFSHDAASAGLSLRPEQLLIFGNPKSGTPLLQASPSVGLDLPLKALVWEDEQGTTWLAYNTPAYVVERHNLNASLSRNIEGAIALMEEAAR